MADPGSTLNATESVPPELILKTLQRIKNSDAFLSSTVGKRLLDRTITAVVRGRTHELNENHLTEEFFPNKFGFKSSSFVKMRSVLKRLRGRLRVYYRTEGLHDDIIFEFRRGVYVPHIYRRDESAPLPFVHEHEHEDEHESIAEDHESPAQASDDHDSHHHRVEEHTEHVSHRRRRREKRWPRIAMISAAGVAGLAVIAAGALALINSGRLSAPRLPQFVDARNLTIGVAVAQDPSVTIDGRWVTYASDRDTQRNLNIYLQQLNGGGLRRLTDGEFDDSHPSISANGDRIAFRSEREPAGVYVMAPGGTPKLIAPEGRTPNISPDGKWIAYWILQTHNSLQEPSVYIVPSEGGQPQRLFTNFAAAQYPIWSPDSKMVLAIGRARGAENQINSAPQPFEWWTSTLDGQSPKATNVLASANSAVAYSPPYSWISENRILFDGISGLQRHLYAAVLNPEFQLRSAPERLSTSTSSDGQPILTAGGMLVFTNVQQQTQIWSVPANHASLSSQGEMNLLSMRPVADFAPSVSRDGRRLVLLSHRPGDRPVPQIRNTGSGSDEPATDKVGARSPVISRDGQHVAFIYPDARQNKQKIEIRSADKTSIEIECQRCERLFAIGPEGRKVLYGGRNGMNPMFIGLADLATQKQLTLIGHPSSVLAADLSPDGRSIVFSSRELDGSVHLYHSRINGDSATEPVRLTDGKFIDDKPRFTPDGSAVYFLSNRDHFLCLYAIRVDGTGKAGQPVPFRHFHARSLTADAVSPLQQELSVANERVILTLQRIQSSIWAANSN